MNSNAIPLEAVTVAAAPDNGGALLHLTTADHVPIAVKVPAALLERVAEQLRRLLDAVKDAAAVRKRLHPEALAPFRRRRD